MRVVKMFVIIDTSSLLASCWNGDERKGETITHDAAKEQRFWKDELGRLGRTGRLILPRRNYEELLRHAKSPKDARLAERSKYILNKLAPMIREGVFEVAGDDNDPFADAIMLSVALKFRTQHNLLFITQDRGLARDLQKVMEFESVQPRGGQVMAVRRLSPRGSVEPFRELFPLADRARPSVGSVSASRSAPATTVPVDKGWWESEELGDS